MQDMLGQRSRLRDRGLRQNQRKLDREKGQYRRQTGGRLDLRRDRRHDRIDDELAHPRLPGRDQRAAHGQRAIASVAPRCASQTNLKAAGILAAACLKLCQRSRSGVRCLTSVVANRVSFVVHEFHESHK